MTSMTFPGIASEFKVEEIECKSARAFLNAISPDNKRHCDEFRQYIFRGQSDHNWKIMPSAFREDAVLFNEYGYLPAIGSRTNRDQVAGEINVLQAFCEELNRNGFHVPNEDVLNLFGSIPNGVGFISSAGRGEVVWPQREYRSIMAVAQHHGIPTRFIDFTYDPFVAAYFAANDAGEKQKDGYIAVFAVDTISNGLRQYGFENVTDRDELYKSFDRNRLYQLVKAPSYFNENLRAQKGVFLSYVGKTFNSNELFMPRAIEDVVKPVFAKAVNYKYMVSTRLADEILFLLHKRFYTASSIFPSINGCVNAVYESARLKKFVHI